MRERLLAAYRRGADGVWREPGTSTGFGYTDGDDVERALHELVSSADDRSVMSAALRNGIKDWPSRYHLSALRANLLRPLADAFVGAAVLEIGAGCGAVTRYLGECSATVVAIEGSPRRAAIAAARCRDLRNVDVVSARLQDLPVESGFDVVTLIGVLEYARIFFRDAAHSHHAADPVDAMLACATRYLKPDGIVVLAIENQLGLKYFAGAPEDHVSEAMFGIEDRYAADSVVTFGRRELADRLSAVGLGEQSWLYPFPDYKLPTTVVSDRAVRSPRAADLSPLLSASVVADPQIPAPYRFSLEQAWGAVFRNGLAGELANSFLVVAGRKSFQCVPDAALAWHYSVDRRPAFAKWLRIEASAESGVRLHSGRLSADEPDRALRLTQVLDPERFAVGTLWHTRLIRLLNSRDWRVGDIADWAATWRAGLSSAVDVPLGEFDTRTALDGKWVDATPRNFVVGPDGGRFIDLEWHLEESIPFGYLLYRALVTSFLAVGSAAKPAEDRCWTVIELFTSVAAALGYAVAPADIAHWHALECNFQYRVSGRERWISLGEVLSYRFASRS